MNRDEMMATRQGVDQMYGGLGGARPGAEMDPQQSAAPTTRQGVFVDQIDGDTATLQMGQKTVNVPVSVLPKGAKEGMYFDPDTGAVMQDPNDPETERRRARLMQDDQGGNLDLGGDQ